MKAILASPGRALALGGAVALAILAGVIVAAGADPIGLTSFLLRFVHVLAAMLWIGMIWFVNFIQMRAVAEADEPGRAVLMSRIVPRVAATFRHASHLTLASGAILLVPSGYLFQRLVFSTDVYVSPSRNVLLWSGVLGGVAMWAFVNLLIWPSLKVVLGQTPATGAEAKAQARERVAAFARLNLALSVPVIFVMVAAAHLY